MVSAQVTTWVDEIVAEWDFQQIIPCHFDAPIKAGPAQFQRAFAASYKLRAELEAREDAESQNNTGSSRGSSSSGDSARGSSSSTGSSNSRRQGMSEAGSVVGEGGSGFSSGFALLGQLGTGLVEAVRVALDARRATPIPFPDADMKALNLINDGLTGTGLVKQFGDAPREGRKGARSRV